MFYSATNLPPITPTPSGKKIIDKYEMKIIENRKQIKKAGKRDIYQVKQESLESTKIYNILKRHLQGDETALNQTKGMYLDITNMPTNLLEAENALLTAKKEFEKLTIEERKKYNQNWREWLNNVITKEYETKSQEQPQKSYIDTITPNQNQPITQTTTTQQNQTINNGDNE